MTVIYDLQKDIEYALNNPRHYEYKSDHFEWNKDDWINFGEKVKYVMNTNHSIDIDMSKIDFVELHLKYLENNQKQFHSSLDLFDWL